MPKIKVLDNLTINQIAAGEVIENPASVVKELVENSIDAGATDIFIELEGGGRDLIRVSDNGSGMDLENALLSLERHATSKISSIDDLFLATTMGFRGEALPSIASISKFSLLTKAKGEKAHLLLVEGGKLLSSLESYRDVGTTIEVRDLFFNVPVRKKFQRSSKYDALDINRIVTKLSLAHPKITFELKNNRKSELRLPFVSETQDFLEQLKKRAASALREEFAKEGLPFSYQSDEIACFGILGRPEHARSTKASQYLIINGRPVYSASISECLKNVYGTLIDHQKQPAFFLHLSLPTTYLDVNVHPQKREVRIRLLDKIKEELSSALKEKLHGYDIPRGGLISEISLPFESDVFSKYEFKPSFLSQNFDFPKEAQEKFIIQDHFSSDENEFNFIQEKPLTILALLAGFIVLDGLYEEGRKKEARGITLIDQNAAFERLIYSSLQDKKPMQSQILLIPHIFSLPPLEANFLLSVLKDLEILGITIVEMGKGRFALEALPALLKEVPLSEFIQEFIQEAFLEEKSISFKERLEKKLSGASVKASRLRDKILTREEAEYIALNILKNSNSEYSPSGAAIFIALGSLETRQLFERKITGKREGVK